MTTKIHRSQIADSCFFVLVTSRISVHRLEKMNDFFVFPTWLAFKLEASLNIIHPFPVLEPGFSPRAYKSTRFHLSRKDSFARLLCGQYGILLRHKIRQLGESHEDQIKRPHLIFFDVPWKRSRTQFAEFRIIEFSLQWKSPVLSRISGILPTSACQLSKVHTACSFALPPWLTAATELSKFQPRDDSRSNGR